ncbi:unnamed protein product [Pseudo-nitzschia multistriata]|uniref:Uncharacterized protein n=1 Tax=Pseudo-nitzschia multistriata TaxID=183589 RepID=A0A448ZE10_9STRA|nr:unnamed protein product [Pseudo-nitzschia multistriata]
MVYQQSIQKKCNETLALLDRSKQSHKCNVHLSEDEVMEKLLCRIKNMNAEGVRLIDKLKLNQTKKRKNRTKGRHKRSLLARKIEAIDSCHKIKDDYQSLLEACESIARNKNDDGVMTDGKDDDNYSNRDQYDEDNGYNDDDDEDDYDYDYTDDDDDDIISDYEYDEGEYSHLEYDEYDFDSDSDSDDENDDEDEDEDCRFKASSTLVDLDDSFSDEEDEDQDEDYRSKPSLTLVDLDDSFSDAEDKDEDCRSSPSLTLVGLDDSFSDTSSVSPTGRSLTGLDGAESIHLESHTERRDDKSPMSSASKKSGDFNTDTREGTQDDSALGAVSSPVGKLIDSSSDDGKNESIGDSPLVPFQVRNNDRRNVLAWSRCAARKQKSQNNNQEKNCASSEPHSAHCAPIMTRGCFLFLPFG